MFINMALAAGQVVSFKEAFDFVRVMESSQPVNLEFFRDGREVEEAASVTEGYSEQFAQPCTEIKITNGESPQQLSIATRLGSRVGYDKPPTGDVTVKAAGAVTQTGFTLTTADQTILAANPARRYLLIQNRSLNNGVQINLTGGPVSGQANPLAIEAGGCAEFVGFCPSGEVKACAGGSTASITVIEG